MKQLESRIDDLIDACQRLRSENKTLKDSQDGLAEEHALLVEKTKMARTRIETMIERLKVLERS